jgi:E3 ubiquitin-protein ligase SHPRH
VSPLEQLGFWRIVLDEAQLVSQTNSVAAQMAAHLWRWHAWVVTGTPI